MDLEKRVGCVHRAETMGSEARYSEHAILACDKSFEVVCAESSEYRRI